MANLSQDDIEKLLQRRQQLLQQVGALQQMMKGSVFKRYSLCSRPNCSCHRGQRHGPRHYVAVTQAGKQRQHYIPNAQVEAVRVGVDHGHRLLAIVDEITTINLALMKSGNLDR